jgi:hypothetical protein
MREIIDSFSLVINHDISESEIPKLIIYLNDFCPPTLSDLEHPSNLRILQQYVSKDWLDWEPEVLLRAYHYLQQFNYKTNGQHIIFNNFTIGLQTPINPYSLNACMLYSICRYHGLQTRSDTTIEQMGKAVRSLTLSKDVLLDELQEMVNQASTMDLINLMIQQKLYEYQSVDYFQNRANNTSFELLQTLYTNYHNVSDLQKDIRPVSNAGAIALAAIIYHTDISKAIHPMKEYRRLITQKCYIPADPWMNYWSRHNPKMFDLTRTFNPQFPAEYYLPVVLFRLAKAEGYLLDDLAHSDCYELLQLAYVSKTFYLGEYPNLLTRETEIELIPVDEIDDLLCYGTMSEGLQGQGLQGQGLHPVTMDELNSLFQANQNFTDPFTRVCNPTSTLENGYCFNSVFSKLAIRKLKSLIPHDSELYQTIQQVELNTREDYDFLRRFVLAYQQSDKKHIVDQALDELLRIGMCMRGAIHEINTNTIVVTELDQVQVDFETQVAMERYEGLNKELGELDINKLPLMIYKDGEYYCSNSEEEGKTIGERLALIKKGNKTDNQNSCIRLSSNWICSSAHRYITATRKKAPFDIFKLSQIG